MNRHEWKTLWRYMRSEKRAGKVTQCELVNHNGVPFAVVIKSPYGRDFRQVRIEPAIIRDRTPTARIASELAWTRAYRIEARANGRYGAYWDRLKAQAIIAAKACIADSRAIRLNASLFWN